MAVPKSFRVWSRAGLTGLRTGGSAALLTLLALDLGWVRRADWRLEVLPDADFLRAEEAFSGRETCRDCFCLVSLAIVAPTRGVKVNDLRCRHDNRFRNGSQTLRFLSLTRTNPQGRATGTPYCRHPVCIHELTPKFGIRNAFFAGLESRDGRNPGSGLGQLRRELNHIRESGGGADG